MGRFASDFAPISPSRRRRHVCCGVLTALVLMVIPRVSPGAFTLFESGPVRPLALSPDGTRLLAVNIPDGRLEMFRVVEHGLEHEGSVPVGLEPVAVAVRGDAEAWVVMNGAGDTRPPMIVTFLANWPVKLPLCWALAIPFGYGTDGIWIGMLVSMLVEAAIIAWWFRRGSWKTRRI